VIFSDIFKLENWLGLILSQKKAAKLLIIIKNYILWKISTVDNWDLLLEEIHRNGTTILLLQNKREIKEQKVFHLIYINFFTKAICQLLLTKAINVR